MYLRAAKTTLKNKTVVNVLLAVSAYVLIKKIVDETNRKKYLNNSTVESDLAVQLHDAFHPYFEIDIPFFGHIPDGTDEKKVLRIAKQMSGLKNFSEVAKAYKSLYGYDLKKVLATEGVFDLFINAYNGGTGYTSQNVNEFNGFKIDDRVKVRLGNSIYDQNLRLVALGDGMQEYGISEILVNQNFLGIKNGTWANIYTTKSTPSGKIYNYYLVYISSIKKA